MEEKKITTEDAFQIWWSIFWRTILVIVGVGLCLELILMIIGIDLGGLLNAISLIVYVLTGVFFTKKAINKNYKNFRLSAIDVEKQ